MKIYYYFISTFFSRKESGERNSWGFYSTELNNCTFRPNRVNSGHSGVKVLLYIQIKVFCKQTFTNPPVLQTALSLLMSQLHCLFVL